MKPLLVINAKTYERAHGEALLSLVDDCSAVARVTGVKIILCVAATELRACADRAQGIQVFAQHTDAASFGAHTGAVLPQYALGAGATGTLLNHSENRLQDVRSHVDAAHKAGLTIVICVADETEARVYNSLPVDYIAVEPKELIGGDVSISSARPELIRASVKACPDKLLVGAGVKTREDIRIALELGAKGVLIASGVVQAAKPREALMMLASGW